MADPLRPSPHWCYQCNSQVLPSHALDELLCPDCGGGFLEALDSARSLGDVRRALRRHQRRSSRPPPASRRSTRSDGPADEPLDDASPRQFLRLLRFLARSTRNGTDMHPSERSHGSGQESDDVLQSHGLGRPSPDSSSSVVSDVVDEPNSHDEPELSTHLEVDNTAAGTDDVGEGAEDVLSVGEGSLSQEDEVDEEEDSDSEAEAGLIELSDWDSVDEEDEDEWEEVEYDEADLVVRFLEAVDDGYEGGVENPREERELSEQEEVQAAEAEGSQSHAQPQSNRSRSRNLLPRNMRRRLQEIRRNIENYNSEVRFDNPDVDTYVGDPGDYVDARGFEELLQQLIDTDSSRRGAPPAAISAVEGLPSVLIRQENLDDGSALCAICKDVVALDEPAKQLPCLHLYHSVCILPWLSSRNSCPVCRYELPTDDPDYEEQKQSRSSYQSIPGSNLEANESNSSSPSSPGDGEGASGPDGNSNESAPTNTTESVLEINKQEIEAEQPEGNVKFAAERSSLLEAIAGPLFSIVGLVVVSCLGNFFVGNSIQKRERIGVQGQPGRLKEVQGRKPWWMRLFG